MLSSALPASRFFPAPSTPFDTEAALVAAGNVTFDEPSDSAITFVAAEDAPRDPRFAVVRSTMQIEGADAARRIVAHLGWRSRGEVSSERVVVVESSVHADTMAPILEAAGLIRKPLTFFAAASHDLGSGERLELDPLFGDEAWRKWAAVEREILAEAIAPAELSEAQLDRSVQFKRKQQRETPPVRRFVARRHGAPVAMIGYAPFGDCDLGVGARGPLVRLRDVAVLAAHRKQGVGAALIRSIAARAREECGATQVLICGASDGAPAALYRSVGAGPIGACTMFTGTIAS
jgi:GNAT superfamily N-acetyltransferase